MSTLNGALSASATGLSAERVRIEAAVSNLANADTTRGADGQPYRRRDVVLAADQTPTFDQALGNTGAVGVRVAEVVQDAQAPRMKYDPTNPDADAKGYVALPNVSAPEEMVNMLGAARAYQANLTAVSMIRDLIQKAISLGNS
ncbi:MAG TPA: flagellar basal body rod protein FlgC [Vicinamibacterales bacterium]|jgi:flagellar basal-body rod protein FlgC